MVKQMTKPVKKFQAGQISGALWENEMLVNGTTKTVLKATVNRRYKDKDGAWKSSGSFSRNEISLAIYCLMQAFKAIVEGDEQSTGNGSDVEEIQI